MSLGGVLLRMQCEIDVGQFLFTSTAAACTHSFIFGILIRIHLLLRLLRFAIGAHVHVLLQVLSHAKPAEFLGRDDFGQLFIALDHLLVFWVLQLVLLNVSPHPLYNLHIIRAEVLNEKTFHYWVGAVIMLSTHQRKIYH